MAGSVEAFYDALAEHYHLIFEDWDRSIDRQGQALSGLVRERWGSGVRRVLDAAAGIGTQALGLAARDFDVVGVDLSRAALARARREARLRGRRIPLVAADFRRLPFPSGFVDVALVCDNALPHLLTHADIRSALEELRRCVRSGGGCLVSMRDYQDPPAPGTVELHPYGARTYKGQVYHPEQEWRWNGPTYELVLRIRAESETVPRVEARTIYLAMPVADMVGLMREAGFIAVARIDGRFYQPLVAGDVP